ncbi:MAG: metallophosphoesterase [Bacteroidota bacterium]
MNKLLVIPILAGILWLLDYLVFQGLGVALGAFSGLEAAEWTNIYWGISYFSLAALFAYHFIPPRILGRRLRTVIMIGLFILYFGKFISLVFLSFGEIAYLLIALGKSLLGDGFPPIASLRSPGWSLFSLGMGLLPMLTLTWGILFGAHAYKVIRTKVHLPKLPPAFEGLKIVQLSDIHSGSFWDKKAVAKGIDLAMAQEADVIFFTGDLVNNTADEMQPYTEIFGRLSAPLGVFSILGNHDYGDYVSWSNPEAKVNNLRKLMDIHASMGWDLLINEHRILEKDGARIAVLGIENWGAKGRFPQYGKMEEAYPGTETSPVKLLLSHDPSHWKAQVIPSYPDVDITFSGHTHGMQYGLEIGKFRWSPVQYFYRQWAGLYQQGKQYLYVNRGFGYLGYPGRFGIKPEITVMTLTRQKS